MAESTTATADLTARVDALESQLATLTGQVEVQGNSMRGGDYLDHFALPNFHFHLTTAYSILRHNGVPLGKSDFTGDLPWKS